MNGDELAEIVSDPTFGDLRVFVQVNDMIVPVVGVTTRHRHGGEPILSLEINDDYEIIP